MPSLPKGLCFQPGQLATWETLRECFTPGDSKATARVWVGATTAGTPVNARPDLDSVFPHEDVDEEVVREPTAHLFKESSERGR